MNSRKFRRQGGGVLFRVLLVSAAFVSLCFEFDKYIYAEITAAEYQELQVLALDSCSGGDYLKQVVAKGPIMNWEHSKVKAKLADLSGAQATSDAKARILHASTACAQPTIEAKK